jgi:hypothetical protein
MLRSGSYLTEMLRRGGFEPYLLKTTNFIFLREQDSKRKAKNEPLSETKKRGLN